MKVITSSSVTSIYESKCMFLNPTQECLCPTTLLAMMAKAIFSSPTNGGGEYSENVQEFLSSLVVWW